MAGINSRGRFLSEEEPVDVESLAQVDGFLERLAVVLAVPVAHYGRIRNELNPRPLTLSPGARRIWLAGYNNFERQIGSEGALHPIRAFASKAAEHSLRLAGTFAFFRDLNCTEIDVIAWPKLSR